MATTKSAIESLMGERGRLRTTHEMLQAALEIEPRDESFVPFYIAVGNFMEASMGRLHSQDVRMLARLGEKLGVASAAEAEIIAEVHRRLDGNREHLQRFLACKTALETDGADSVAVEAYESTSRAYIDYIHNRMGHHAPSTDLARRLFDESDWVAVADMDAAYFAEERKLYDAVQKTRPDRVPLGKEAEESVARYRRDKG